MIPRSLGVPIGLLIALSWVCLQLPASIGQEHGGSESPSKDPPAATGDSDASARSTRLPAAPVTVKEARRQAELLHTAVHATLQLVHHRYYREDEGLSIPAAVLDEVFAELEANERVKLRWLAVEGQAMNSDHKPRDPFEVDAVAALKAGKGSFDRVEKGIYRRAGAITLTNHCLKCHVPDRKSTENRTAGLIVSIPIAAE